MTAPANDDSDARHWHSESEFRIGVAGDSAAARLCHGLRLNFNFKLKFKQTQPQASVTSHAAGGGARRHGVVTCDSEVRHSDRDSEPESGPGPGRGCFFKFKPELPACQ